MVGRGLPLDWLGALSMSKWRSPPSLPDRSGTEIQFEISLTRVKFPGAAARKMKPELSLDSARNPLARLRACLRKIGVVSLALLPVRVDPDPEHIPIRYGSARLSGHRFF